MNSRRVIVTGCDRVLCLFTFFIVQASKAQFGTGSGRLSEFLPFLKQNGTVQNELIYQKVADKQLEDYDNRVRANATSGLPANILVSMFDYKVKFDLRTQWIDPRIAFGRRTSAPNGTSITFRNENIKKLWIPDIFFENEKKAFDERPSGFKPEQQMRIYSNGTVIYVIRLSMKLSCDMDLKKYPMDTQTCYISMASYSYTEQSMTLKWTIKDPMQIGDDMNLPKFKLVKFGTEKCTRIKSEEEYPCIRSYFKLKREFSFHLLQTFFPTILLVFSSWISFFIDPNSVPARVSIGVTTLLSIVNMMTAVRVSLPPVSYIKAIDTWMFMCILYIFGALIEFAIMNHAQVRFKNGATKMFDLPRWCGGGDKDEDTRNSTIEMLEKQLKLSVITDPGSKISTIGFTDDSELNSQMSTIDTTRSRRKHPPASSSSQPPQPPAPPQPAPLPKSMNIDGISRYGFPITFLLFNIIYWSYYGT